MNFKGLLNLFKHKKMEDNSVVVELEPVEILPLSAEDEARLEHIKQIKEKAYELAKPMLEEMRASSVKKGEPVVVARMGLSAFSVR
jgi:hypothetical protein